MLSRREVLGVLGALPAASVLGPGRLYAQAASAFPRRLLGRTGRTVVPLGLGGQASLQWTASGIDAPNIIVRAVQLGVNYLDSANRYGPSRFRSHRRGRDETLAHLHVRRRDGEGLIPEGAYLDAIQIHNLTTLDEVNQVYEGYAERGLKP